MGITPAARYGVWVAGVTFLMAACGGSTTTTSVGTGETLAEVTVTTTAATTQAPPTTAAPTTAPPVTEAAGITFTIGALQAGTYATKAFAVPFTVDLPPGWYSDGENFQAIGFAFGHNPLGVLGEGANPSAIYLIGTLHDQTVDEALEAMLSTSFNLAWSEPVAGEIGGYSGTEIDGVNQGNSYSIPAFLGSGRLFQSAGEGRQARAAILDLSGQTLVVFAEAQPEDWDEILALRDELLSLMTFSS